MERLPDWAYFAAVGALVIGWLEMRFVQRKECIYKHQCVDEKLDDRSKKYHTLANAVTPLTLQVEIVKHDVAALKGMVERIHNKVLGE